MFPSFLSGLVHLFECDFRVTFILKQTKVKRSSLFRKLLAIFGKNNSACVILINFHSSLKFTQSLAWCPTVMEMVTCVVGTINMSASKVL